ncbi:hypothetical protein LMG18096_02171 [Ralstonia holmesii]|uniref:Uncharacterized protein n=1 Tax=Ralstonia holmesii TaxID=3058602 RepID=A0ABC8QB18_9RALS|nr:hypothetical protein LMG18096_02171 [Ralstonia sp. LMG 32967]CAJ0809241.1 hypothetical protein LMG18093_00677 [Ralstonia sp. LMG 32967]
MGDVLGLLNIKSIKRLILLILFIAGSGCSCAAYAVDGCPVDGINFTCVPFQASPWRYLAGLSSGNGTGQWYSTPQDAYAGLVAWYRPNCPYTVSPLSAFVPNQFDADANEYASVVFSLSSTCTIDPGAQITAWVGGYRDVTCPAGSTFWTNNGFYRSPHVYCITRVSNTANASIELMWVSPSSNPPDSSIPNNALGAIVPSKIRGTNNVHYSTATLKAVVKTATGSPIAGAQVSILVDVTQSSGYHNHASGNRPKGILSSATIPISYEKIQIPGITDGNGEFQFNFTATDFASEHKMTASCTDRTCGQKGKNLVLTKIPSLIPLAANGQLYTLRGASSTHQSNHNFTSTAQDSLIELATRFRDQNGGTLLIVNDGSLPFGGLYDFTNNWANPHKAHRRGVVVDINNFTVRSIPFEHLCKDLGIFPSWEGGSHPHYHLWLIGQDG